MFIYCVSFQHLYRMISWSTSKREVSLPAIMVISYSSMYCIWSYHPTMINLVTFYCIMEHRNDFVLQQTNKNVKCFSYYHQLTSLWGCEMLLSCCCEQLMLLAPQWPHSCNQEVRRSPVAAWSGLVWPILSGAGGLSSSFPPTGNKDVSLFLHAEPETPGPSS